MEPTARRRSARRGTIAVTAALFLPLLGGCSDLAEWTTTDAPSTTAATPEPSSPAAGTPQPSTAAGEPTGTPVPVASPGSFALRFVREQGPPCAQVWLAGSVLPANYEWCADEVGGPVAGVRIGSCEVVVYNDLMYAVPGRRIRSSPVDVNLDPSYRRALTACKRAPFAPEQR